MTSFNPSGAHCLYYARMCPNDSTWRTVQTRLNSKGQIMVIKFDKYAEHTKLASHESVVVYAIDPDNNMGARWPTRPRNLIKIMVSFY
ncbi:hypothetical protein TNIN_87151 [Trichonephila inaurata madagascariensis]|uniref:Uncharacterized protein n=1 Tax=Trichonephila inaurata madagascariensis TaxID=2747483 RepID=A0A8X6YBF3_9ARAC|nr:hypothetical protein TNIN_87151 [Trichonephila inaurata madagascariensis]